LQYGSAYVPKSITSLISFVRDDRFIPDPGVALRLTKGVKKEYNVAKREAPRREGGADTTVCYLIIFTKGDGYDNF